MLQHRKFEIFCVVPLKIYFPKNFPQLYSRVRRKACQLVPCRYSRQGTRASLRGWIFTKKDLPLLQGSWIKTSKNFPTIHTLCSSSATWFSFLLGFYCLYTHAEPCPLFSCSCFTASVHQRNFLEEEETIWFQVVFFFSEDTKSNAQQQFFYSFPPHCSAKPSFVLLHHREAGQIWVFETQSFKKSSIGYLSKPHKISRQTQTRQQPKFVILRQ